MITFCILGLIACLILEYRNKMVCRYRHRAIDILFHGPDLKAGIARYEKGPSYTAMLLDLTKWKFEQFYPGIARPGINVAREVTR